MLDIIPPFGGAAKDSDNEGIAFLLEGSDKAATGRAGPSSLAIDVPLLSPEENLVVAFEANFTSGFAVDRFVLDLDSFAEEFITNRASKDKIHVVSGCVLCGFSGKTIGIGKLGMLGTNFFGALIHHLNKLLLTSRNRLS